MKVIRITYEVWDEIAKRGKFGETPDDVLRRVFRIGVPSIQQTTNARRTLAQNQMSARVEGGRLKIKFKSGEFTEWLLPDIADKGGIRKVRDVAVAWANNHGATLGQRNAVKKALTDKGYHVS